MPPSRKPPTDLARVDEAATVRVRQVSAELRTSEEIFRGRTEAVRMVDVKAETYGRVVNLDITRGGQVTKNQPIVTLDTEDRPALLTEAKALLAQRQIEYEAAEKLSVKGFRTETSLAEAKAALEAAQARIRVAETKLADTVVRAPFDGLVDEHMVEIGDFVETGDSIARVVDLDPILVVAQVNEKVVGHLRVGQTAEVRLFAGQVISGRLRFISSVANPATRTFQIELEVDNPDKAIADGLTAELRIPTGESQAYHVSPAILTLTDDGRIGVKTLDEENRVVFRPVRITGSDDTGVWLSGLPERLVLITVGQEFVKEGQIVRPIDEATLEPFKRDWDS